MNNQIRIELSESGKTRKAEMLVEVQDSMIDFHRSQRGKRKHRMIAASVCIPVVAIGMWIVATNNSENRTEGLAVSKVKTSYDSDENISNKRAAKPDQQIFSESEQSSDHDSKMTTRIASPNIPATQYSQLIVQQTEVTPREMESIDDDQLMELLKQAGVDAWLAEINDERIVLTKSGRRL